MTRIPSARIARALLLLAAALAGGAQADEAAIRKALAERMPNLPAIDEISRTAMPGLYEVRMGSEVLYADEQGNYLIEGSLYDTRNKTDITKARLDKLSAVDFASLPLKDAFVIRQGNGSRRMAVFADPNCGYCKRLERDLLQVKDVTIYTFLIPVLGPDSTSKTRDIWCTRDAAKTWRAWMIDGVAPPKSMGACNTDAVERNLAFSHKHRIQGTPAIFFEDGTRNPGAMTAAQVEKALAAARKG